VRCNEEAAAIRVDSLQHHCQSLVDPLLRAWGALRYLFGVGCRRCSVNSRVQFSIAPWWMTSYPWVLNVAIASSQACAD
jgi:hypothetical protein